MSRSPRVISTCKHCQEEFQQQPSRVWRDKFCSPKCSTQYKVNKKLEKQRTCLECGEAFFPRLNQLKNGQGKYCSRECRNKNIPPNFLSSETREKALKTWKQNKASGKYVFPSGEKHPKWKGGQDATVRRRIESGKAREAVKAYRAANPEKVSEWGQNRRASKIGRVPRGTVKRLLKEQENKCAYCDCELPPYHLDHKLPISRGGNNDPENLHLTCPRCNLRKNAMTHEEFLVSKKRPPKEIKLKTKSDVSN